MAIHRVCIQSVVRASPAEVWARATTLEGVNDELWPLLRMTYPAEAAGLGLSHVTLGERLFRSWILLGGVVPVDRSDLTIVALEEGRFLERSPMLAMRLWEHERTVEAARDGCQVTDRLAFEPRIPGPLLPWFVRRLFEHRHARLQRYWGERGRRGG